uniref:Uncharacterized protein n=1 Tax=Sander lucioperca TaxID=283035 RepID=A0A8D0AK63_SANLU
MQHFHLYKISTIRATCSIWSHIHAFPGSNLWMKGRKYLLKYDICVTMTMRQISPTKKLEKMEGWEPPHLENLTETVTDEAPEDKSLEEDSSRYANLSDSKDSTAAVRWTARAKVKLAGISRMSRGIVSEIE